jgi:hypothetical protein
MKKQLDFKLLVLVFCASYVYYFCMALSTPTQRFNKLVTKISDDVLYVEREFGRDFTRPIDLSPNAVQPVFLDYLGMGNDRHLYRPLNSNRANGMTHEIGIFGTEELLDSGCEFARRRASRDAMLLKGSAMVYFTDISQQDSMGSTWWLLCHPLLHAGYIGITEGTKNIREMKVGHLHAVDTPEGSAQLDLLVPKIVPVTITA